MERCDKVAESLTLFKHKMWDELTGGGDSCFFAKDLEKHPMIYNYVMMQLKDYITYVCVCVCVWVCV